MEKVLAEYPRTEGGGTLVRMASNMGIFRKQVSNRCCYAIRRGYPRLQPFLKLPCNASFIVLDTNKHADLFLNKKISENTINE
jgi:hypothetical protein